MSFLPAQYYLILDYTEISSELVTNWGTWGNYEDCPWDEFVNGLKVKSEGPQGEGDDTALNGIRLFCSPRGSDSRGNDIQSKVGSFGDWGSAITCNGGSKVIGFQLRSEAS